MAKIISNTYGDALFDLAKEQNKVEALLEQTDVLVKVLMDNPELLALLNHPRITKEEKKDVIDKSFKGKFDDDIVGLLAVIVDKDRAKDIISIFEHFRERVYDYKKIGIVYVTSATEITAEQKKKIEEKMLKQTGYISLEMNYKVDAGLLGGMVIRLGDRVVDSSLRNKLDKMTAELRKTSVV